MEGLVRGFIHRKNNLPNSILYIQKLVNDNKLVLNSSMDDGRLNSAISEKNVILLLQKHLQKRLKIPKIRMWYDILVLDFIHGWLPVNIKISTMKTSDNSCNMTALVHAFTPEILNFDKIYKSGSMSKKLLECISKSKVNLKLKKDYYFLVVCKSDKKAYVNSLKGLEYITPNLNNLPFQIRWDKNTRFSYKNITKVISNFIKIFDTDKECWKLEFLKEIKQKGQYFTTNVTLQNKVKEFVKFNQDPILEPSIGRGDLVSIFKGREFIMYELDENIELLDCVNKNDVKYCDFLETLIENKFKTIVANPPYVKSSSGNLYIKFIEKCYSLLVNKGEMIFIIPSDFFKTTKASGLIDNMYKNGSFTHVFHPNNERMFENASIDIMIFRYLKDPGEVKSCVFNDNVLNSKISNGILTFSTDFSNCKRLGDFFDIKVGIVSGCDKVFKSELGNTSVLTGENTLQKYICYSEFPTNNNDVNKVLLDNKELLMTRKIKKFTEKNWFQWGALRNVSFVEENIGKPCIYIHNISRKSKVAFIGVVGYFSGNLLMMLPKTEELDLKEVVDCLNSIEFKKNYIFSNRFKIGHKQLQESNFFLDKQ